MQAPVLAVGDGALGFWARWRKFGRTRNVNVAGFIRWATCSMNCSPACFAGMDAIDLIASRHFRTPVAPSFWFSLIEPQALHLMTNSALCSVSSAALRLL